MALAALLTLAAVLRVAAGPAVAHQEECRPGEPLPKPKFASEHNGGEWPQACVSSQSAHVFAIGDWGGTEAWGKVAPYPWKMRSDTNSIDTKAQHLVAERMILEAEATHPVMVLNAGGNFYPAGIRHACDSMAVTLQAKFSHQFSHVFENMYKGKDPGGLTGKPWFGVLGNVEYGHHRFDRGWVHTIYYTWRKKSRWVLPAQYYKHTLRLRGFHVDFFFVDTNVAQAFQPHVEHGICQKRTNKGSCSRNNPAGPKSAEDCFGYFQRLWAEQAEWLDAALAKSTADWQVLVMHHPPETSRDFWREMCEKHGIDLIVAGHVRLQEVRYGPDSLFGSTAVVLAGGGGGVFSAVLPDVNGHDNSYGFMDIEIWKDRLRILALSHGGEEGKRIVRSDTTVLPRPRGQR